jgi:Phage integrase family
MPFQSGDICRLVARTSGEVILPRTAEPRSLPSPADPYPAPHDRPQRGVTRLRHLAITSRSCCGFNFVAIRGGPTLFEEIPRFLGSPHVFWHDDGEPFTNFFSHFHRKVKAIWRWAKASGVDFRPFTFHSLRHSHAIEFLRSRTGTLHELQFRLGHSTIKTAEEYINSGLLSAEEVQWALFGGHGQGVDFSGASGHKSGHSG